MQPVDIVVGVRGRNATEVLECNTRGPWRYTPTSSHQSTKDPNIFCNQLFYAIEGGVPIFR